MQVHFIKWYFMAKLRFRYALKIYTLTPLKMGCAYTLVVGVYKKGVQVLFIGECHLHCFILEIIFQ